MNYQPNFTYLTFAHPSPNEGINRNHTNHVTISFITVILNDNVLLNKDKSPVRLVKGFFPYPINCNETGTRILGNEIETNHDYLNFN